MSDKQFLTARACRRMRSGMAWIVALVFAGLAGWAIDPVDAAQSLSRGQRVALPQGLVGTAGQAPSPESFRPMVVIPRPMPAITKFPVVVAAAADRKLDPAELILGISIHGASRAYPINMLTGPRREILNDTLAGTAIAATW